MKLILLGAPGAGKGTQAEALAKKLEIPVISTGDILRASISSGSPMGLELKRYMDAGKLVPDEVVIGIVIERLAKDDCEKGYILDGMPRTIAQALALEQQGVEVDTALSIEITDAEIEARMVGRRTCPGCGGTYHIETKQPKTEGVCDSCGEALVIRSDDKPETVRNRLQTFHEETEPLKGHFEKKGKLLTVDNVPGVKEMTVAIFKALEISDD